MPPSGSVSGNIEVKVTVTIPHLTLESEHYRFSKIVRSLRPKVSQPEAAEAEAFWARVRGVR